MAILKPDKTTTLGGVTVNEYLLTKHNPNSIDMPSLSMEGKIMGVTIHNTDWITTASDTTPAEQYTRATVNGNMGDVRVHYYVDNTCAWQNLPLKLSGWHAADGDGNGNTRTIAIECIMSSAYNDRDKKSEDNAARIAAELLKKYQLTIDNLYTHNHWYSGKYCPAYILPHWNSFKAKVQSYMKAEKVLDKSGYKYGDNTIGSYALKFLLLLAKEKGLQPYNMDENSYYFGDGTKRAVNHLLKKWGYAQNGIAGKNFEKKLYEELKK